MCAPVNLALQFIPVSQYLPQTTLLCGPTGAVIILPVRRQNGSEGSTQRQAADRSAQNPAGKRWYAAAPQGDAGAKWLGELVQEEERSCEVKAAAGGGNEV